MSILVNKNTKLIVQGITGRDGSFHACKMKAYGTNVVGGVSPGKGGQKVDGIPVFNTVEEAVKATGINAINIMQPSILLGDRNEKRFGETIAKIAMKLFSFLLIGNAQKYKAIHAKVLAQAMVNAAKNNKVACITYQYAAIVQLASSIQS